MITIARGRRVLRARVLTACAVAVAILGGGAITLLTWTPSSAAGTTVAVGNNWFGDSGSIGTTFTVNIDVGDTIEWTWEPGAISHTVTEADSTFSANGGTVVGNSGISTTGYGPITFSVAGTYYYYCFLHPVEMRGQVNVSAPPATAVSIAVGNNWYGSAGAVNTVFTVDINAGDTIEWVWQPGAISHTVTETGDFVSPNGGTHVGDSGITTARYGPITFTTAGTYDYYCFLHPVEMRGRVNVTGSTGGGGGGPGPIVTSRTRLVAIGQPPGDDEDTFVPPSITINAGDTITWGLAYGTHSVYSGYTNSSDGTVYRSPGGKAGMPGTASSFSRTFTAPGTYTYYCEEHAGESDARLDRIDERIAEGKMVGKIVVLPADVNGPVTSAISLTPNPASGIAQVTVVATIADLGSPNSIVVNAEAFIGPPGPIGTGAFLPVGDGSWDSPVEQVSGALNIGGLAAGDYAVSVRGQDQRGNWGTVQAVTLTITTPGSGGGGGGTPVTIDVLSGALAHTTAPVQFPAVVLDGSGAVVETQAAAWRAVDSRGTSAGWNVVVTSTDFTSTTGAIPVSALKVRVKTETITTVAGAAPPTSSVPSFESLDSVVPLKIVSAAPGTGMGTYDYQPEFQLAVGGSTLPGSYVASLVVTIASGP